MISKSILKGTIVFHKEHGQGIFKSEAAGDNVIVEFEDDVFEVAREELTEVE